MILFYIPTLLRKSKIFNKGRYSRTRQIVRGAFFFSLSLNLIVIFGALFLFYLYTISWSYIWWPFYLLLLSIFIPSFLRQTSQKKFYITNVYFKKLTKNKFYFYNFFKYFYNFF